MKDRGILRISEALGQDRQGATVLREHVRTDPRETVTGIGNVLLATEEGIGTVSRETVTETERDPRETATGIGNVLLATEEGIGTVSRETVIETERDPRETATALRMIVTATADRDADRANGRIGVMTEEEVTTVFRRLQWRHRSRSAVKGKVRMIIRRRIIAAGMKKREQ